MKTKASGWGGNRRFKDHGLTLLYGIVGTKPAVLTNGQAYYPALVHWFPPQDRSKQASLVFWLCTSVVEYYLVAVELHNYPLDTLLSAQRRVRETHITRWQQHSPSQQYLSTINKGTRARHEPGHI